MRMYRALLSVMLLVVFVPQDARAQSGQVLVTPNIGELCRNSPPVTYRRTVVYVDIASVKGKTDWGLAILNKLELGTREHLTVLAVNPNTFETKEMFDSCYPTLTKFEMDAARKGRGTVERFFTSDPADQQRENLQTFDARLRNSLDKLIADAARYDAGKRRNVLGAIAFDKNRFAERNASYRIILYTDGVLIDPAVESGANEIQQINSLREKYPASFSGAEILVFGVTGQAEKNVASEKVFATFFLNNWARLKSFSFSLPQQRNDALPPTTKLDGSFEGGGTQGTARLTLLAAKGDIAADGWLAFIVGRTTLFVPFQGDYKCDGEECKLSATTTENVPPTAPSPYFRNGDRLILQGKEGGSTFSGTLQGEARELFKEGNAVKYDLKFAKQ